MFPFILSQPLSRVRDIHRGHVIITVHCHPQGPLVADVIMVNVSSLVGTVVALAI